MKIGALAKQTQVTVETIRYYEQRQLLNPPARSKAGYRNYSADDLKRLRFIVQAKTLGFTLEEVKELLTLRSGGECAQVREIAQRKAEKIADQIEKLHRIQRVLEQLTEQCGEQSEDCCPILKSLEEPS